MNQPIENIHRLSPDERLNFLIKEVKAQQKVWILTDEHGCVMLNTDDEDCVPVWPSEHFAKTWATGEWEGCTPMGIELNTWFERWTSGLAEDEVMIAAFPGEDEEGIILFPDEFEDEVK